MLIDTHAHLNFNAYKEDFEEVIKRTLKNDVWMINVGTQYQTSKKAIEIAQKYEKGIYAAIGLHPLHLNTGLVKMKIDQEEIAFNSREEEFDYEKYKELTKNGKVVAVGEIGLDYYYKPKTKRKLELFKEKQREVLLKQLNLAEEFNLPVIFHCRMAHEDLLEILSYKLKAIKYELKGVMHGFVGTAEQLQKYLKMGFYIGFNGIIFKTIEGIDFAENIKKTPLDKILIETDCPYLTPPPLENQRNEPMYVKYVAEEIAKIKKISYEEIARVTTENAKKLFKI
jgi:TatD DNase family protein